MAPPKDATVLLALADRCEREGPSPDLDKTIYAAMDFCLHEKTTYSGAQSDTGFTCDNCHADSWGNRSNNGKNQRLHDRVIAYTTSLDAAVTLVPEGHNGSVYWSCEAERTAVHLEPRKGRMSDGMARTHALALCAAALRARAAVLEQEGAR